MHYFIIDFSKAGTVGGARRTGTVVVGDSRNDTLNPIGAKLRSFILDQLEIARESPHITYVILFGGGGNFSVGADLTEFASSSSSESTNPAPNDDDEKIESITTTLLEVVAAIEEFPKPILAALQGKVLGGGLEIALACHYRIATPNSSLGLPEVKVGLIPGAGGTQRLPKLIGTASALDMILSGKPVSGTKAMQLGLVDAISVPTLRTKTTSEAAACARSDGAQKQQDLLNLTKRWGKWATLMPLENRRVGYLPLKESPTKVEELCQAASSKLPSPAQGGEALHCAIDAIKAIASSLEEGLETEFEMLMKCMLSPQGMARRHVFFAIRQAQKPPSPIATTTTTTTSSSQTAAAKQQQQQQHALLSRRDRCAVGVIGAGTMGSGIAIVLLKAGYSKVYLVDVNPKALRKGIEWIHKTIQTLVRRNKWTQEQADHVAKHVLVPTTKLQDLKDCQLIVEAVVENLQIKQSIFRKLDDLIPRDCILVSNTSTLDIDEMAKVFTDKAKIDDPQQQQPTGNHTHNNNRQSTFAGWHFFSPAHVMPLVEIVAGSRTSTETIGLLQSLTKEIGKIGVVVGNCDGFCGNRMIRPYSGEAVALLIEGNNCSVEQVNQALTTDFGMAVGPFTMSDLAGNDVGYNIRRELGWVRDPRTGLVPKERPARYTELADDLVTKLGRTGQKVGKGWSDYDPKVGRGFKPLPSKKVAEFIKKYVVQQPGLLPPMTSSTQIVERLLFALVNEGFKCLEENIAHRPSDIDVIYIFGYGWPVWRGGPMYWADNEVGLENLLDGLNRFRQQFPQTEHYVPSKLLEECVRRGLTVEEYYKKGLHHSNKRRNNKLSKL